MSAAALDALIGRWREVGDDPSVQVEVARDGQSWRVHVDDVAGEEEHLVSEVQVREDELRFVVAVPERSWVCEWAMWCDDAKRVLARIVYAQTLEAGPITQEKVDAAPPHCIARRPAGRIEELEPLEAITGTWWSPFHSVQFTIDKSEWGWSVAVTDAWSPDKVTRVEEVDGELRVETEYESFRLMRFAGESVVEVESCFELERCS